MKKEKYQILISAITDKRLRLQDLGLLATMLTMKEGWEFSVRGMTAILPAGKTKTANTINRLIANGYIKRQQANSKGCYGKCTYQFFPHMPKKIKSKKTYRPKLDADRFGLLSECLRDTTMTLEERGLYLKLLSLSDDWQHSVLGLSSLTNDSRSKVTNTLKKLIDRGLIKDIEVRKNGRFAYHILEPIKLKRSQFKKMLNTGKLRKSGNYYEEITLFNNPDTVRRDIIKKEKNISFYHNNPSVYVHIEKIVRNRINYDSLIHKENEYIITKIKDSIVEILCLSDRGRIRTSSGIKQNKTIKAKTLFSIREAEVEVIYDQITKTKSKIKNLKNYIKQAIINLVDSFYLPALEYDN